MRRIIGITEQQLAIVAYALGCYRAAAMKQIVPAPAGGIAELDQLVEELSKYQSEAAPVAKLANMEPAAAERRAADLLSLPIADDELLTPAEALKKLEISFSRYCDVFDSDDACCAVRALRVAGWELTRTLAPSGEIHITLRPPRGG